MMPVEQPVMGRVHENLWTGHRTLLDWQCQGHAVAATVNYAMFSIAEHEYLSIIQ